MKTEEKVVEFVLGRRFGDIPPVTLEVIKSQVLAVLDTTIMGSCADGCETVVAIAKEPEGKSEASILIHGGGSLPNKRPS